MSEKKLCPHCSQPIMEHKHTFSNAIAELFLAVAMSYGEEQPFHLQRDISLTKNQYNNFQKLKYWGVIEKHFEDGARRGGYWHLTEKARDVLNGEPVPKWVKTFNNRVVEKSEQEIFLTQAVGSYDIPETWAKRSTRRDESNQQELFI